MTRRVRRSRTGLVDNCAEGGPNFGYDLTPKTYGMACANGRWRPGRYSMTTRTLDVALEEQRVAAHEARVRDHAKRKALPLGERAQRFVGRTLDVLVEIKKVGTVHSVDGYVRDRTGLPPELPGMAAADLAPRQLWWWGTAVSTGAAARSTAACASAFLKKKLALRDGSTMHRSLIFSLYFS